jgi:hypothetical protein
MAKQQMFTYPPPFSNTFEAFNLTTNGNIYFYSPTMPSTPLIKYDDLMMMRWNNIGSKDRVKECSAHQPKKKVGTSTNIRVVTFGFVEIHEHTIALGVSSIPRSGGAPVTLSYECTNHYTLPIDDYETKKPQARTLKQLFLRKKQRLDL